MMKNHKPKITLQEAFPHIAAQWHNEKNNLNPSDMSPDSRKRAWWVCLCGKEWQETCKDRTSKKSGCPNCSKLKKFGPRKYKLFLERVRVFVGGAFLVFIITQQILYEGKIEIVIGSRRNNRFHINRQPNENNKLVMYKISQLENIWHKAAVKDLITPEKIANSMELKLAHARLKEAEKEIQEWKKRVVNIIGKKQEFLQKMHAYYYHSAANLIVIIEFLLDKEEKYKVKGDEIGFESKSDTETFQAFIYKFSELHHKKPRLDSYIASENIMSPATFFIIFILAIIFILSTTFFMLRNFR